MLVRLKSHGATQYAGLYNVMKGVALAAVVFLPMLLTVTEVLVVGIPSIDRSRGPMPFSWFAVFAFWGFLAAFLVRSADGFGAPASREERQA